MRAWYEEHPNRWDAEQTALKEAKIEYSIDEEMKAQGILCLHLVIPNNSSLRKLPEKFLPLKLDVLFPTEFPFLKPTVIAPEITLPRHQNPTDKNLCLLPRSTSYWTPETTLARHLEEQLHKVLIQGEIVDPETIAKDIDEQAEPISEYYRWYSSIIFDPQCFDFAQMNDNKIRKLGQINFGIPLGEQFPCRMAVLNVSDEKGNIINRSSDIIQAMFPTTLLGAAYQLSEPPPLDAEEGVKWLTQKLKENQIERLNLKHEIKVKGNTTITEVTALTFPEEHSPGKYGWGWLFIISYHNIIAQTIRGATVRKNNSSSYYARINRFNPDELAFRNPSLKPLSNMKIAVIGLGALGGPSAIAFAKNGVGELKLVDDDIVSAGTIIRWPLGVSSVGLYKTAALKKFIGENYPATKIQTCNFRIGSTGDIAGSECFENMLSDVSLIYDATAETGINQYLANQAKERGIPYVSIYATPGVWGGVVLRVIPGVTDGCWLCAQYSLEDGTFSKPATNEDGNIQAIGCGDISFIGTSFELENIVAAGIRMAISTLCQDRDGYPILASDIGVLSLVDDHGNPVFPRWTEYPLLKNNSCPDCSK
jgi:hypothetical protein